MATGRHIIKRQILELELSSQAQSWERQEALRQLYYDEILPRLEEICDRYDKPGIIVRLDKVEIDTGVVRSTDLDKIPARVAEQFEEQLNTHMVQGPDSKIGSTLSAEASRLELLQYYLLHGVMPWYHAGLGATSVQDLLQQVLKESRKPLLTWILPKLRSSNRLLKRIAWQMSPELSYALAEHQLPGFETQARESILLWQTIEQAATIQELLGKRSAPATASMPHMSLLTVLPDARGRSTSAVLREWVYIMAQSLIAQNPDQETALWQAIKAQAGEIIGMGQWNMLGQIMRDLAQEHLAQLMDNPEAAEPQASQSPTRARTGQDTPHAKEQEAPAQSSIDQQGDARQAPSKADAKQRNQQEEISKGTRADRQKPAAPQSQEKSPGRETEKEEDKLSPKGQSKAQGTTFPKGKIEDEKETSAAETDLPKASGTASTGEEKSTTPVQEDKPSAFAERQSTEKAKEAAQDAKEEEEASKAATPASAAKGNDQAPASEPATTPKSQDSGSPDSAATDSPSAATEEPQDSKPKSAQSAIHQRYSEGKSRPVEEPEATAKPKRNWHPSPEQASARPVTEEEAKAEEAKRAAAAKAVQPEAAAPASKASNAGETDTTEQKNTHEAAKAPGQPERPKTPAQELAERYRQLGGRHSEEPVAIDEAFIPNAGLILLVPFIGFGFKALGYGNGLQMFGEEAQSQAAWFLHYLVTGRDEPEEEYNMALNKLLVGLTPEDPLLPSAGISQEAKDESQKLISSALKHWSALKSDSHEALRHNFLQRKGVLRKFDHGWQLQPEAKSWDVLMETLPWSLGMVRQPWMNEMIYVEW